MSATRPTKKQKELLEFIGNFITAHGYSPSYREIMRGLNYRSVSTVATHIDNLIAKGWLIKRANSARSLEPIDKAVYVEPTEVDIKATDAKWLIDLINSQFKAYKSNPNKKHLDELYVLTGALQIIGLTEAAESFKQQLKNL